MKYNISFRMVNGREIRMAVNLGYDIEDPEVQDRFVKALRETGPLTHFYEDGKLVIVNMSNVTSIVVSKAE